ncbi:MAG: transrane glycosyltransferase [Bacteroidetes bacterium]|jgi:glycosyltransferase involved in cell wall biosynthesis|nr:transrane glycosyltransferase [Bacteroidota bacterium]
MFKNANIAINAGSLAPYLCTMPLPQFQQLGFPEILCIIAALGFLLVLISYFMNYLPLSTYKGQSTQGNTEPVSIVICAKNEDENLTEFLPKVLTQDYPEFEVIVVNDCSFDNTENVIDEFAKIFPNLKKANIKEDAYYKHGKKFALLVGIKAAKYNRMLLTDADCYPSSDQWLKEMSASFSTEKQIVLGYGAYEKQKGFLNKLIRFDAFMIAVQYLSAGIRNKAYMGVGRNLAYNKDLFFSNKGFASHYHINSGDDDLFVNEASTSTNTNVCVSHNSITYSKPKKTFRDWRLQKSRHLTTAPLYKGSSKSRLTFTWFSQYFFYLSLIGLCLSINTILLAPIVLFLKMVAQLIILNKSARKLNEPDLLFGSVIYEVVLLLIYPIFHLNKLFYKPNKWTN